MPSTSATNVVCGFSFSRSQPDFKDFLRALWFPPSSKSTPSLIHLAVVLCSEVIYGLCSGAESLASGKLLRSNFVELRPLHFSLRTAINGD